MEVVLSVACMESILPLFLFWRFSLDLLKKYTYYDMKNLIGEASCRICQENFSTTITALTEPIDIYSEWIDECERVNNVEDDGA
ncbi:hypothetical protein IEQ34_002914 [Dendrobium chrysotoxum]|uniref:Transcription elongation factor 1 homolog n=1 Tax=Dendrobium chrysotoxum TaxID=161865 RepID=A0AAV7HFT5_DENCH|nr:hypothetical protein IEQ34_002914 [Dendrobium chrysotoxum]